MKRYFVIFHQAENNSHINVQDLLPASCRLITGIAVNATAKQEGQFEDITGLLSFPQNLIKNLLEQDSITGLFYSYLRTRASREDSRAYFINYMLPSISATLSQNIKYTCFDDAGQATLEQNINDTFNNEFTDYLYGEIGIYEKGQYLDNLEFTNLITRHILLFAYKKQENMFSYTSREYKHPEPYECGNISLLVNGNSFLLRDYMITANRKVRHMKKEIIPFHEPLEVNSYLHTVFKNNKNSGNKALSIRIYIEYEALPNNQQQE